MTDYVKTTDFAAKDALPTGNPNKVASGTQVDTELNNIALAIASKADQSDLDTVIADKIDTSDIATNTEAAALTAADKVLTPAGLAYAAANADGSSATQPGFRGVPNRDPGTGNYTCVLADNGRMIVHEAGDGAGDTYTIPANSSVAFPIGATLTFVNLDTSSITIAIGTDTMYLAGYTTTGNRTLARNGHATALKVASTVWLISGPGLS